MWVRGVGDDPSGFLPLAGRAPALAGELFLVFAHGDFEDTVPTAGSQPLRVGPGRPFVDPGNG